MIPSIGFPYLVIILPTEPGHCKQAIITEGLQNGVLPLLLPSKPLSIRVPLITRRYNKLDFLLRDWK